MSNMKINRTKSGVMVFDWKRKSRVSEQESEEVLGYPVVRAYKYLGSILVKDMKL